MICVSVISLCGMVGLFIFLLEKLLKPFRAFTFFRLLAVKYASFQA